ncbi:acetyltransferase [Vogesella alkaliphila]|uniref:acetyltransferase n=1 Tax=Vogesella alkaliphila TaxID=1193621 RepID=UPI001674DE48|nr:acetyltransferase [Vogesella alkaliphila]
MNKPLIILGAGGHAAVLVDILRQQRRDIMAIISPGNDVLRPVFDGLSRWHDNDDVLQCAPDEVELVNGLGSLPGNTHRQKLYGDFVCKGYVFAKVIADSAVISPYAHLGDGVQVLHKAVVQAGTDISENTIINTASVVEHDCCIGAHNHLAPGSVLSGGVHTGNSVHISTGAVVIQNINIGDDVVIGAGVTINKNVAEAVTVYGARPFVKTH